MKQYDVVVIGGGAAGLMCALTAGQRGRSVAVLERANKAGKKILMSGGGRCNFTNLYVEPDNFLSKNPHFCKSALSRYSQWDFIELVERHGIAYHEKTQGQLFCDDSAKRILAMLLAECDAVAVDLLTGCDVESVAPDEPLRVNAKLGDSPVSFTATSVVVAAGGLSIPTLGGSGVSYEIARQFGLKVLPLRAGLVPVTFTDSLKTLFATLSGISVDSLVSCNGVSFRDAILFTHRGLSGPAILQISSYWQPGDKISINLLPSIGMPDWLMLNKQEQPKMLLRTLLAEQLPKKLVLKLERLWWPQQAGKTLGEWSNTMLMEAAQELTDWQLKPAGTEGYRTAEVTLGGIDTAALSSKTMECKTQPGLYFIGEAVDVTGHLGGFNFQWAWASGYAAGQAV